VPQGVPTALDVSASEGGCAVVTVGDRSVAAKRCFDAVVAATLLAGLSPLILAVAIAIKLDSRGPVLYRAKRVGRGGSELQMLKFRKMHSAAEGSALTLACDERFTRIGRWLARSKIDEIPQLWNVLRGEMSLIGPRPEDGQFVANRPDDFVITLLVKPGITGLSQLAFARESDILDPSDRERDYVMRILPQKLELDSLYARRSTFAMDLAILAWTLVYTVSRTDVAVDRTTGRMSRRTPRDVRPIGVARRSSVAVTELKTEAEG